MVDDTCMAISRYYDGNKPDNGLGGADPSKNGQAITSGPRVYFIRQGDAIKIGFSENVTRRLAALQSSHHEPLTLLATIPATVDAEQNILERFRHLRIKGEWFRAEPELIAFISNPVLPEPPAPVVAAPKPPEPKPDLPKPSFPTNPDKFKEWGDYACRGWPGELQVKAFRAWMALQNHAAYPAPLIEEFSDDYALWRHRNKAVVRA